MCLNALNLASAWCLEHDFVRLRKVSKDWYCAFQYVPDEVVQTCIELQHSKTSHRWWQFNGFDDGLNKNVDYLLSLFTLFAVPLLRPVTISTTKSNGHDPRHSSCYVSTVWSMLLSDVSFSMDAVQVSPQWDHTLVLMSPNLCYDIRFQVSFTSSQLATRSALQASPRVSSFPSRCLAGGQHDVNYSPL